MRLLSIFKIHYSDTIWLISLAFINSVFSILIYLNNIPNQSLFWSLQSFIFSITALYGHFFFLFLLAGFPGWFICRLSNILHSVVYYAGIILTVIANMLLLMVIYLNARIFELYKFHIDDMVLELITGGALQEILSFDALMWTLVSSIVAGFIVFEILLSVYLFRFIKRTPVALIIAYSCMFLFFLGASISQSIYVYADAKGDSTITSLARYIPWAQTITAKAKLRKFGIDVVEISNPNFNTDISEIKYPRENLVCLPEHKFNIVFIIVDSLRDDMLTPEIMPASWQMAQRSHHFTNYFSMSNSTRLGIFTLMYGINGNFWHPVLATQTPSMFIEELVKQNYKLYINAAAPLYSPEFDRTVFSSVKEQLHHAPLGTESHIKDKYISERFIEQLKAHDKTQPFFSFLFYDSPHSYSYPKDFKERFTPSWSQVNYLELNNNFEPTAFLNRYKNSASYVDSLVGKVLNQLKKQNVLDNSIVVFTSDHGQEFNETGQNFWGHNSNFSIYQTQVPLFIHWPGKSRLAGAQQRHEQIASIDIVPTLMSEALNCQNPIEDYSSGLNIYATDNNYKRPLLMESWSKSAIVGENYILVSTTHSASEVFDRNYQVKPGLAAPKKDLTTIFKQLGQFKK